MVSCPRNIDLVADECSGKMLNCGLHSCPQRCHQLQDHSKMNCKTIVVSKCSQNHKVSRKCHDKAAATCRKCASEAIAQQRKLQRDYKLDQERQMKQQIYASRLAEIEDEIRYQKRVLKDEADERDRQQALTQKRQDLLNLKAKANSRPRQPTPSTASNTISPAAAGNVESLHKKDNAPKDPSDLSNGSAPSQPQVSTEDSEDQPDLKKSEAEEDWEWQKQIEGAENEALDSLIAMIGWSIP